MNLYTIAVNLSVIPEPSRRQEYLSRVLRTPHATIDAALSALFRRAIHPSDKPSSLLLAAIVSFDEWSLSRAIPAHVREIAKVSRELFLVDHERVEALTLAADCFKSREVYVGIPYLIDLISLIPSHMRSLDVCLQCASLFENLPESDDCEELLGLLEEIPEAERVEIWKTVANWLAVPYTPADNASNSETVSATDEESDSSEDTPSFHPLDSSPVAGGIRIDVLRALVESGDKRHFYVQLVENLIGTERGQVVGEAVDTLLGIEMDEKALEKLCHRVIELTAGSSLSDRAKLLSCLSQVPEEKREALIAAAVNFKEATLHKVSLSFVVGSLIELSLEESREVCELAIIITAGARHKCYIRDAFDRVVSLDPDIRNAVSEIAESLTKEERPITRLDLLPIIYPRYDAAQCARFFELIDRIGDHYLLHQLIATKSGLELLELAAFLSEGKEKKEREKIVEAALDLCQIVEKYLYPIDKASELLPLLATTVKSEMREEQFRYFSSVPSIDSDTVRNELSALFSRLQEDKGEERSAKRRRVESSAVDPSPPQAVSWIKEQNVLPIGMMWLLINRSFFRG